MELSVVIATRYPQVVRVRCELAPPFSVELVAVPRYPCRAAMADQPKSLAELVADSRRVLRDRLLEIDPSDPRIAEHTLAAMKATRDAAAARYRKAAASFPPAASAPAGDTTSTSAASAEAGWK